MMEIIKTEKFYIYELRYLNKQKVVYNINIDINSDYTSSIIFNNINIRSNCNIISNDQLIDCTTNVVNVDYNHHNQCIDNLNKNNNDVYPIQMKDFENINWDVVMNGTCGASSYLVRKGLSRKAQLSLQLRRYCSKHIDTILHKSIPYTVIIETWNAYEEMKLDFGRGTFASFDDLNLIQAPLRQRLDWCLGDIRSIVEDPSHIDWYWILKPSVTNKGYDIAITKDWNDILNVLEHSNHVREWVLQQYIEKPLLIKKHKFHLRVYILCVGALRVFVFNQILMLIAAHPYQLEDIHDIYSHLTNTARSVEDVNFDETKFIRLLDDLPYYLQKHPEYKHMFTSIAKGIEAVDNIKTSIHNITNQLFAAYENEYSIFCPMSNCYEVFGLDFMIDDDLQVYLLEVNPGPDFQQTGYRLNKVISDLWQQINNLILDCNLINPNKNKNKTHQEIDEQYNSYWSNNAKDFTLVYSKETSTAKLTGGMSFIN